MKKLVLFVFILILFVLTGATPFVAAAVSTPHIVVDGEVWLLDETGSRVFLMPESYYARINNLDDLYYYVTFNGVSGKISKNTVSTTGYHTSAKGTSVGMGVNEAYQEFVAINLKSSPSILSENTASVPTSDTFTFIGEYPTQNEGMWYYVKYNQYYGYIRSERTNMDNLVIDAFIPEPDTALPTDTKESDGGKNSLFSGLESGELRILIIIGLAVPAVLIIFLLFRPSKNRKYYD